MLRHLFVSAVALALLIGGLACGSATSSYPAPSWEGDKDRDGVADAKDDCADVPEDFDGYKDTDGCVDADNDSDGIEDAEDLCPSVKGEDPSGCPGIAAATERAKTNADGLDEDGDGIAVPRDQCADKAEDFDGRADDDGCPEDDVDGDGIADGTDRCDDRKEDGKGSRPSDGCPLIDSDNDGVGDDDDQCRTAAGPVANNGCPACVASWTGDAALQIRSPTGVCGTVSIKSGDMTCTGTMNGCSATNTSLRSIFSCKYDKIDRIVAGTIEMTCDASSARATVLTQGNSLSWTLTRR